MADEPETANKSDDPVAIRKAERDARLALELRANLKRRKLAKQSKNTDK